MFARLVTAKATPEELERVTDLAEQQLLGARERPGYLGFYLLVDDGTGNVATISLWATREAMEEVARATDSGTHDEGADAAGLSALRLTTYEVKVRD